MNTDIGCGRSFPGCGGSNRETGMNDTVNQQSYCHLYGPVPSRRLGRSLGIDLVPYKTCTYDCVYCQLGRTTNKTLDIREYISVDEVLEELKAKLAEDDRPDYITLAGSGEPTLNSGVGRLIEGIKAMTRIPVAVITNGSLLWDSRVSEPLSMADLVVPSLDAGDGDMFQRINRPHGGIDFARMAEGLVEFRKIFRGLIWLEVMVLEDVNDQVGQMEKIARYCDRIMPDRVHLNTAIRPPAEPMARPVLMERLQELARLYRQPVDVVCQPRANEGQDRGQTVGTVEILALIARRPCTVEDVAAGLGIHRLSALKELEALAKAGRAKKVETKGRWFYMPS